MEMGYQNNVIRTRKWSWMTHLFGGFPPHPTLPPDRCTVAGQQGAEG